MNKIAKFIKTILLLVILLSNNIIPAYSDEFKYKLKQIQSEINRNNLDIAIQKLKSINITNENQQEYIDILFGDIYLKINQPQKAEEFYQKALFTSNEEIETLTLVGISEVRLIQGRLDDAINYANKSIKLNANLVRPKIILAIAKTRIGEGEEALQILNELYSGRKNAEVALAISDYYSAFDDTKQAIEVLEKFTKREPNNIKILDQLASLYLFNGDKEKALEKKIKVFEYHKFNKNKKELKEAKLWIISIDPNYFDNHKSKSTWFDIWKKYEEVEVDNYEENKINPHFENFDFVGNSGGSGFIIGDGKFVVTNIHVIENATKIGVRNGIGKVRNAKVHAVSKIYDLAILKLEKPYPKKYSISEKNFSNPKAGEDVIILGYPAAGLTFDFPTITQGIISKVFYGEGDGIFLTSATVNPGNSGGPVINLEGKLVGVIYAATDLRKIAKATGVIETAVGFGISSNKIEEIYKFRKKNTTAKKVSYNKSSLYEKMLPHVVNVEVFNPALVKAKNE